MMRKIAEAPNEVRMSAYKMVQLVSQRMKENEDLEKWKEQAALEARMEAEEKVKKKETARKAKVEREECEDMTSLDEDEDSMPASGDTRIGRIVTFATYGHTNGLFTSGDPQKFETHFFHITADVMKSIDIALLRRHDYYKGWYDCNVNTSRKTYARNLEQPHPDDRRFFDDDAVENPVDAGWNAGALFTFAALCKEHNKVVWNTRLDDREWDLAKLEKDRRDGGDESDDPGFWRGFDYGQDFAKKDFEKMLKEEDE
jgi:hypothetical protein